MNTQQHELTPAPGTYRARATCWGLGETKGGTEQYQVELDVIDGAGQHHTLTWYGSFANDKAFEITMKALRALGMEGEDLSNVPALPNEVNVVIAHEEYPEGSGDWKVRVRWINAIGGGIRKLDEGKAASFAERMKARIAAFDARNGTAASSPRTATPSNGSARASKPVDEDESDIPF